MSDLEPCPACQKEQTLCVCTSIEPRKFRTAVLILQHPQEPDKQLGTARIANLSLENSSLKVGLSWRNLEHALGVPANPKEWAVLYLGSAKVSATSLDQTLVAVDKKGVALADQATLKRLKGLVILDGTWSQAKALWWRNAWLLKLQRAVLIPPSKSLYGNLRKEPRPDSLSTIESI